MKARLLFLLFCLLAFATWTSCKGQVEVASEVSAPVSTNSEPRLASPEVGKSDRDEDAPIVLFLGDSISAGYGLPEGQAFPALVQQKIIQAGLDFKVLNAGVSGDTSAGGLRRVDWYRKRPTSVLVLELGGNDGLRGVDLADTKKNLQVIIDRFRENNPGLAVVIAGMMIPPNLGPHYTQAFQAMFPELAEANNATLIPFLLEGVGGVPELNLPDGIHPTAEGHEIVAELVWQYLEPVLQSIQAD